MYRVMLADDEPLILAGIASMLCWEDHQCKIVGKAANGVQALEKMQELKPDIVITDIRMPAMDGITLVRRAKEQGLGAVFILLTNLEEFSLARDAVSLGVVDYLVKLELSEETLADALKRAVMRCEENRKQGHAQEERTEDTQEERIRGYFRGLLFSDEDTDGEGALAAQVREQFAEPLVMLINFNYGVEEFSGEFTRVDQKKVMGFAEDIIREMVKGFFDHSSLIRRDQNGFVLVLSVAETPDYETQLRLMGEKLQRVLKDYFEVSVSISASRPGKSIEEFQMLYYQATGAMNYTYYDWADSIVFYSEACESGSRHSNDFNISFLKKDLSRCLRQNDSEGFGRIMDQVISLLEAGRPARHQAINACSSLYYFITAFFEDREDICFPYVVDIIGQLNRMKHSSSMIQWIGWFRDEVKKLLSQASEVKLDKHVELAKRYVQEHCREKISLSQTAEALNISPGYLSSSFKKQTGKNFSDYVNEVKVEEARKLIATHQYMMYEISDLLGFDTQYYFSTVFKKMTGQSPREYEMQIL